MRSELVERIWRTVSVIIGAGVCIGMGMSCATPDLESGSEQVGDHTTSPGIEAPATPPVQIPTTKKPIPPPDLRPLLLNDESPAARAQAPEGRNLVEAGDQVFSSAIEIEPEDADFDKTPISTLGTAADDDVSIECTGTLPGSWSHCSAACPCDDGGGDCDSDAECAVGGRCMRDVGPAYGWPSTMDVCEVGCVPAEPGYVGSLDFCSPECPCDSGHGDCDTSADCGAGLVCGFDLGADFGFDADTDVCISPTDDRLNGHADHCTDESPCASGHGDCDSNSQCQAGLACGDDLGANFGFAANIDVCLDPADDLMNGQPEHCTEASPCPEGHGDCDNSDQCQEGLGCGFDFGADFGLDPETDVCINVLDDRMNGHVDHCDVENPCEAGHGDCDSDAECTRGTRCSENVGETYGFGANIDVCEEAVIYSSFSGRVVDSFGEAVIGVEVDVNGTTSTTNGAGGFNVTVLQSDRYVINTHALGFVPTSQIHSGDSVSDMTIALTAAESFEVDPAAPIAVTDERGTDLELPAGALVDASGNPPAGPVTMQVHTFDPVNEGMVGNMEATNEAGEPVILQSAGAVSVDFVDAEGTEYQLGGSSTATITLQVSPDITFSGVIEMWHYDMDAGAWVQEGYGMVVNGVATATVSHFSTWNFDIEKREPACIRVFTNQSAISGGEALSARVRVLHSEFPATRNVRLTQGHNALYNLPTNTTAEFFIPPQATIPYRVVNTSTPWGGVGVPPFPFKACNAEVKITGPLPGVAKGFVKLGQQGTSSGTSVQATRFGSEVASAAIDESSKYGMVLPPGSGYRLEFDKPGYLSMLLTSIEVVGGKENVQPCIQLRAGDVNGDDTVDSADVDLVTARLGEGAGPNDPADFNGDGVIDGADLEVVQGNQGMRGPLRLGDGLSGCFDKTTYESEPNEDGSPETGGGSAVGNDFSIDNADGPFNKNTLISAEYNVAGDEDVFAIENTGATTQRVRIQTYNKSQSFGAFCNHEVDTVLHVRDAAGTSLAFNDDYQGYCSRIVYNIPAGETVYLHSMEYGDDEGGGGYYVDLTFY